MGTSVSEESAAIIFMVVVVVVAEKGKVMYNTGKGRFGWG
jgi:hypothetical protein